MASHISACNFQQPAHLQTSVAQNVADSITGQRLVVASTGVSLDDTNTTATTALPGSQAVSRAQEIQASLLDQSYGPGFLWICLSCQFFQLSALPEFRQTGSSPKGPNL